MRDEYDFSKASKNPYASQLKKQITIRLDEAGTSFQQVLGQTRHELAKDYLSQRQLSLADIAFLLGYQEQSAFNHAFKGWFGISPGSYRVRL